MSSAFAQSFAELTAKILTHSENLLTGYQPYDLHQFRVSIRRTRSLLKQTRHSSARDFAKAWGGFFASTGHARDFDVFGDTASRLLSDAQHREFAPLLRRQVQASHAAVLDMLRSAAWQRHLEDWHNYLAILAGHPPEARGNRLPKVRSRARKACRKALAADDDYSWHRFRIAVKNLRYVADASRGDAGQGDAALDALIEDCKALQTLLGDWHDTVVQLELIERPEFAGLLAATPGLREIRATLAAEIGQSKRELLAQIRVFLATHDLFGDPA